MLTVVEHYKGSAGFSVFWCLTDMSDMACGVAELLFRPGRGGGVL